MGLEKLINENQKNLNENDYHIIRYVMKNTEECQKLNISTLAQRCSISPASIVRMTKKLGFSGYSEFKYYLKGLQNNTATSDNDVLGMLVSDIEQMFKMLQNTDFESILLAIDKADRIYAFGSGYTQRLMLKEFNHCMANCNKNIYLIPAQHEFENLAPQLTANDLIIVASNSGNIKNYENCINLLNILKVPILSVTNVSNNDLASKATYSLYYQSSPFAVTNSLRVTYCTLHLLLDWLYRTYLQHTNEIKQEVL